jgi:lipase
MRLHVHEWGNPAGRPVVCLHGVTAAGTRFKRLAEQRLGRFRIVALDLRAHGESEWEPPWTFETLVDDVLETLDDLGVGQAAFIGHSLGGRLVLELAEVAPERIERAALLDPAIQVLPHVALDQAEGQRHDVTYASLEEAVEERLSWNPSAPRLLVEESLAAELDHLPGGRLRPKYCRSAAVAIYGELASRYERPPRTGVPTPGACAGSTTSMSRLTCTKLDPARCESDSRIARSIPIRSTSLIVKTRASSRRSISRSP